MHINESFTPADNQESPVKSKSFWKNHFEQFKLSNLNKSAYARTHGLVIHRFMYWSRKLEEAGKLEASQINDGFIPVHIKPASLSSDTMRQVLCTLELANGHQLFIHTEAAIKACLAAWR